METTLPCECELKSGSAPAWLKRLFGLIPKSRRRSGFGTVLVTPSVKRSGVGRFKEAGPEARFLGVASIRPFAAVFDNIQASLPLP
jgi:hypothetical protein